MATYVDFTEDSILLNTDICTISNHSIPNPIDFNQYEHLTNLNTTEQSINTNAEFTRYIITFHSYKNIDSHTSFIKSLLANSHTNIPYQSYQIISRSNIATLEYPTDFIILQIYHHHHEIKSLLSNSSHIKHIHIDKIIHKHLLETKTKHPNHPRTGGKLFTNFMEFEDNPSEQHTDTDRSLLGAHFLITEHLGASKLWQDGYDGTGVNVAVFDTGIDEKHGHFNHIEERTNWTDEDQLHDGIGHGTFVCGIIASKYEQCPGFAPNAIIHTFRVFTNAQMSYTSWFLDAFNYAIHRKMNILNLSIGGPDWLDLPFVDKVREMQANNVIMITACGNDGKYGTINNPADQLSVIGVGGITQNNQHIAGFQSRGMTTWEMPDGYGRVKPDIVTVGQSLYGSSIDGGCRTLSGTSVASPVATGVAALLTSVVPANIRWDVINPASLKQVFVETADTIDGLRLFEQGNGMINLQNAYRYIQKYKKHISAVPDKLDFTQCPHLWPFCRQPLYHTSQPYIFNLTLLNPFSVIGEIPNAPTFEIDSIMFENGRHIERNEILQNKAKWNVINIEFKYSKNIWPWCGWLGVYIHAKENNMAKDAVINVSGVIKVEINVIDHNKNRPYNSEDKKWILHKLSIPYTLKLIPTPPRNRRILWDQYHNLAYPLGYFPRDDLEKDNDMLDWFGDHLHTNYHTLYDYLKDHGYFVEVLTTDYSCIDPSKYSTLIIVDSEDKFHQDEIKKFQFDVLKKELSVLIFADWYNEDLIEQVRFFDDNTRSLWDALTGGANIVALNELLDRFGIQFGDMVAAGDIFIGNNNKLYFQSGSIIMKSPINSMVLMTELQHIQSAKQKKKSKRKYPAIPLMIYDTKYMPEGQQNGGRIAVFGDSTCLDANQHRIDCFWLMDMLLRFTCLVEINPVFQKSMTKVTEENMQEIFNKDYLNRMDLPQIVKETEDLFNQVSRVHNLKHNRVKCWKNITDLNGVDVVDKNVKDTTKADIHNIKKGVIEASTPLMNDKLVGDKGNKDVYKFVMQPHLGDGDTLGIHHYDIMLFYPFVIMILFMVMICTFCRPIRRLFLCDKLSFKMRTILPFGSMIRKKSISPLSLRKVKIVNNDHLHV